MIKGKVTMNIKATKEQYEELMKLSHKKIPGKPYSPFGKYLIDNFGDQLSDLLFEQHEDEIDNYYQNIYGTDQSIQEESN